MKKCFVFIPRILAAMLIATLSSFVHAQNEGDLVTTVADKGESGMFLATFIPVDKVCIDKNDAEIFSFYVDEGTGLPYFAKLMPKGGKFCMAPGNHVVVKTSESKAVTLETTAKSSSVTYDNVISPTEDTHIEDFRAKRPVAEGEYIYMLTNMEKNGGFGFTYFTGTTMKKGNFYIVSTREPEATGIQTVKSNVASVDGAIYNLQGIRVPNPAEGQIYIQNGRKFVMLSNATCTPSLEQSTTVIPVITRAAKDIEDGDPVPFLPGEAGDDDGF